MGNKIDLSEWAAGADAKEAAAKRIAGFAKRLAADGGGAALLFSGAPDSGFRFSDARFRRLCPVDEPGCWLWVDSSGEARLYVRPASGGAAAADGPSLAAEHTEECCGVAGFQGERLEQDISGYLSSGRTLWLADGPHGCRLIPGGWALGAKGVVRDFGDILEKELSCLTDFEKNLLRGAWKVSDCAGVAALESMWRGIGRQRGMSSMAAGAAVSANMGGFDVCWETPGEAGPLARAISSCALSHPLCSDTMMSAYLAVATACGSSVPAGSKMGPADSSSWAGSRHRGRSCPKSGGWFCIDAGVTRGSFSGWTRHSVPVSGTMEGFGDAIWKLARSALSVASEGAVEGSQPAGIGARAMARLAEGFAGLGLCSAENAEAAVEKALGGSLWHHDGHTLGWRRASQDLVSSPMKSGQVLCASISLCFREGDGWPKTAEGFSMLESETLIIAEGGQPPEILGQVWPRTGAGLSEAAKSCGAG